MIRSFLKKGLGKILGGGSQPPAEPKAYPFKYEGKEQAARAEADRLAATSEDHGHSHSHDHAPEPTPEPVEAAPQAAPEPQAEPQAAPSAMPSDDELALTSVPEIKKLLAEFGIKPRSKANKAELIQLLKEAHGGGSATQEEDATPAPATTTGGLDPAEVQELLDDMVRPALQADGGDIQLVKVDGMDVHVQLVGACTTCPSSIMTMKMGVEALFKEEFPGFGELIQING